MTRPPDEIELDEIELDEIRFFDLEDARRRIAELEADLNQTRFALVEIRDKAATMTNGGAWAAGLATLCAGTLRTNLRER